MLLLDDDDELPASPEPGEVALVAQLGPHGLQAVDDALLAHAKPTWMKVARIVHDALSSGGFRLAELQRRLQRPSRRRWDFASRESGG
jgi:hypothetical protein